jgi:DNA-binding response OmpR family regulator
MSHALIVEDDIDAAQMMAALVATENFTVATANTLRDARRQIALQQPDIVLLDLQLPDGSGMELFEDPQLIAQSEVVLITGHASLETSIQALRMGAADYLIKPVNVKQLHGILSRVMRPSTLKAELATLNSEWERTGHFGELWGRSASMQRIYQQISRVAGTAVSVFLTGESGTGKEVVARTVHDLSRRRARPFLAVNCGAISPNLIESELFGHEKGSFTGADRQHHGFFERAHGGTLFLDEITEMPLDLQVKLLRVLETGVFMRVGSSQSIEADVRVIAARAGGRVGPHARGPAVPAERVSDRNAATARAHRGHRAAGRALPGRHLPARRPDQALFSRSDRAPGKLSLARQRARAAQCGAARVRDDHGHGHHRRMAAGQRAGGRADTDCCGPAGARAGRSHHDACGRRAPRQR